MASGKGLHKPMLLVNSKTFLCFLTYLCSWLSCTGQILTYQVENFPSMQGELQLPDSSAREKHIQKLIHALQLEGYPTAAIKSRNYSGDTLAIILHAGEAFHWLQLRRGNLSDSLADKAGFDKVGIHGRPLDFHQLHHFFDGVLEESQNIGYPFATIRLDSISIKDLQLAAAINFDPGPFIVFDTVEIGGDSKTKADYLSKVLRIPPGAPFSQASVDRALRGLQKLPYVQLVSEPQLSFQNTTAKLFLPLTDRRINSLDGIVGVLPSEAEDNKLLVTGQFNLAMYNVAGRGRDYLLQWQRLSRYSQNLSLGAKEPMLLGSLIDLAVTFELLKQDTSFLNRDFKIELKYPIHQDLSIGFFSRRQSGDLLDLGNGGPATMLRDAADFRFNSYGVNFLWSALDHALLPKSGWFASMETGLGNKRLLENSALPSTAYDEAIKHSLQYYLTLSVEKHLQLNPRLSTWLRIRAGEMDSKNLFINDLFRLGGLNSIRGFNENFFFAKRYVYANFEPRYYFDNYSYFLLFVDFGELKDQREIPEKPLSLGAGFSLETNEGVFSFIYALGKSETQLMGFNFSKIHFGYTGRF